MTPTVVLYAFFGGILPAIIWLYFLLKEDSRCPEPKHMIWLAFIVGMIIVPLAIIPQKWSCLMWAISPSDCSNLANATFGAIGYKVIFSWAAIEEMLKYIVAAIVIFPRRSVDESPDYVIYMLTIALGFAATENMLFLLGPLSAGDLAAGFASNNLRFMGANLVHVLSSAAIGFALAFSYRKTRGARIVFSSIGLILAILLHTAFNALIMMGGSTVNLSAFLLVWSAAVIFFATFEILKYIRYRRVPKNTC